TAMVGAYAQTGRISEARALFDGIPEQDTVPWNAVISGYSRTGRGRIAIQLFHEMLLEGLKPNEISLQSVMAACSHVGLVKRGLQYLCSATHDFGIVCAREHFACLVDVLGRAGQFRDARELIFRMPFKSDFVSWTTLVGS
ncbi:hypothetical protein SELMODRAFT_72367, partial [Selaginella moellendorffii]